MKKMDGQTDRDTSNNLYRKA